MLSRCCWLLLSSVIVATSGCAMCSSCDDYCYTGWGGTWERLDQCFGRVGSAFTPEVGSYVGGYAGEPAELSPEAVPAGEPTPAEDPAPAPPDETEKDKEALPPETSVLQNRDVISR